MIFSQHHHVIVVFSSYETAVLALDQLIVAGFSPTKVFIVGKELDGSSWCTRAVQTEEQTHQAPVKVFIEGGNGFNMGWLTGSTLGGVIGILLGLSVAALPGVDGMMLVFKIVFTLASGFFCTVSGGIIGALIGLGVAQKQVKHFGKRVTQGKYLVVIKGTRDETNRAKHLLKSYSLQKK